MLVLSTRCKICNSFANCWLLVEQYNENQNSSFRSSNQSLEKTLLNFVFFTPTSSPMPLSSSGWLSNLPIVNFWISQIGCCRSWKRLKKLLFLFYFHEKEMNHHLFPVFSRMQNLHDICRLLTFVWAIQGNCFVGSNQWLEQIVAWNCFAFVLLSSNSHIWTTTKNHTQELQRITHTSRERRNQTHTHLNNKNLHTHTEQL